MAPKTLLAPSRVRDRFDAFNKLLFGLGLGQCRGAGLACAVADGEAEQAGG